MRWNPFDRRSADIRAIDDTLVGLDAKAAAKQPDLVREALKAWRGSAVADPSSPRREKVRKIVDRGRGVDHLGAEHAELLSLRSATRGRVVHAVVVLAAEISSLSAWTSLDTAHRIVRIDLVSEVTSVALSAGKLEAAFVRLGPKPTNHLADDAEVQKIYHERIDALADRQRTLIARLTALRSYLDGLVEIDRELQKVRWIENHGTPDNGEYETREGDELGSLHLNAARDMFDETTDRIGAQLRDAVEQLDRRA